jgi:hypothetical protein
MTMGNDGRRRPVGMRDERGFGWGIPLAIAAALVVGGLLFFNMGDSRTTTASNTRPTVTQTNPSSTPAPVPAPATTPAPKQ